MTAVFRLILLSASIAALSCRKDASPPAEIWRLRFATLSAASVAPAFTAIAEPEGAPRGGMRNYRLRLNLPEALSRSLRVGQTAVAVAPLASRPQIPAKLSALSANEATLRLQFADRLIDYLSLKVSIPGLRVSAVSAPVQAVYAPDGERAWLFVLRDGKLKRVGVQIVGEELQSGRVLLIGELQPGEKVTIERIDALLDGDRAEERQ